MMSYPGNEGGGFVRLAAFIIIYFDLGETDNLM